ncbi:phosphatase PAP2 family protein [Acinetobacter sp. 187]|uniref:phosphatase PAP2 family protein n=1 Tax=Acinetobacter lanii TaxID=2715163 RepID=UPI00140948ED|nr:phosphatase PAP2 family protein [Acinetobacter lanii]NHC04324.1 phosphatase PAP2 family protein [Acinetobacter lanii]
MPYFLIFVACLGLIISTLGIEFQEIQQLDVAAVAWMNLHHSVILQKIAVFLSKIGGLPGALCIAALWCLYLYKSKRYAHILFISFGFIGGSCIGWMLKFLFNRARPDAMYQIVETYGASFPSGHSLYAAVLSCLVVFLYYQHAQAKIILCFACLWSIGMGLSRVYVGAHFPTDVLAGWSIALIWVALLWFLLAPKILSEKHLFLEKNLNEVE